MKKHITAWLFALAFISGGLGIAGCEPEGSGMSDKHVCTRADGSHYEC